MNRQAPGLHPSFRPERFDFGLHEGLEVLLQRLRVLALQLVAAQFHPHQAAQQHPGEASRAESLTTVHLLAPSPPPTSEPSTAPNPPELVVPDELLPRTHDSLARFFLVVVLRAVLLPFLRLLPVSGRYRFCEARVVAANWPADERQ